MNTSMHIRTLPVLVLFAVTFGVFAVPTPKTAHAWVCTLSTDKATILEGESAKVMWDYSYPDTFSIDNGIGVITTDNSFKVVSPNETTTYTGTVTDKKGRTAYCKVTITVVKKPVCALSADKVKIKKGESVTLSWTSQNTTHGSGPFGDKVDSNGSAVYSPETTTTYPFTFYGAKNQTVTCEKTIEVEKPKPIVPICTLQPKTGRIIIDFKKSDGTYDKLTTTKTLITKNESIPAGTYAILAESFDGYHGRSGALAAEQSKEQWNVEFYKGSTKLNGFGPTIDIPDGVEQASTITTMATGGLLSDTVTKILLVHAFPDAHGPHSVSPICIALDKLPDPEPEMPVCTMTADKDRVTTSGDKVTLTWTSDKAVSATLDNGVGTIALNGSKEVTITNTTTYTSTFTNAKGKKVTCAKTITYDPPVVGPVCAMSVSPNTVTQGRGESVTLTWSSQNVTSGSIDNGVGSVPTNGSTSFIPNSDTLFTGTFGGPHGTTTCTARLTVTIPQCTNCGGGGSNQPRVEVAKRDLPNENPLAFVYLSQVPYTGFEAGPFTTALYWFGLFALSAGISYFVVIKNGLGTLFTRRYVSTGVATELPHIVATHEDMIASEANREVHLSRMATNIPPMNLPTDSTAFGGTSSVSSTLADAIEERAHSEQILLSPEAITTLVAQGNGKESHSMTLLENVLPKAKMLFPREDGWILVNKERLAQIFAEGGFSAPLHESPVVANPHVSAITARFEVATGVTSPIASETSPVSVGEFLTAVAEGNQERAFRTLRTLSQNGGLHDFLLKVVGALDDVYRNRIEGGRKVDAAVASATSTLSNANLEELLAIVAGGIDYSYTSEQTGAKVMVAKVTEFFASKGK